MPVLLILTWVALYLHRKLPWRGEDEEVERLARVEGADGAGVDAGAGVADADANANTGVPKAGYFGGRDANEGPHFDLEAQEKAAGRA